MAAIFWLHHLQQSGREPAAGGRPDVAGFPPDSGEPTGREPDAPSEAEAAPDDSRLEPPGAATDSGGLELPISIEGRVSDEGGNGVAGARVTAIERRALAEAIEKDAQRLDREALEALRAFQRSLRDVGGRLPSCLTAADGRYALRGLTGGEYRVAIRHDEFLTHAEEGWILVETGRTVRYDAELARGQEISGAVRDAKGVPVAGARVLASPVETARLKGFGKIVQVFIDQVEGATLLQAGPVETDRRGVFRVTSLEPGVYDLRAVKEGHSWGEAHDVPAGTRDLLIALGAAIGVSGRVVSPRGDPVASAAIALREPERDVQGPEGPLAVAFVDVDLFHEKERAAASDGEGRFALQAFAWGTYDLVVRAEGFPELHSSVELEDASLDLGDIALAENREIAGTILSPDGRPVEGAAIWAPKPASRREDRDSRRIAVLDAGPAWSIACSQTDARGAFRLTGLGEASCEVAVLAEGYPGVVLESVAAGGRSVTVVLERGLTIRGRVVAAEGREPVSGARVAVEGGPAHEATTGADGRFELRGITLAKGEGSGGSVPVRAAPEGYHQGRATAAFPDPAAFPVAEVVIEVLRLAEEESRGEVSGIVHGARGEPIAGARVWAEVPGVPRAFLCMMARDRAKEARTGTDGSFSIPAPRFGGQGFEVLASYPGLATSRRGPFPAEGDGGVWPFVDLELGEGAALEGRVTGPDGSSISGARICVRPETQQPEEATIFTRLLPQPAGEAAYSGRDGSYRLRRIEPGSYRVEAQAPGYAAKTISPVEIRSAAAEPAAAPGPTTLDIALERGGSLAGRVLGQKGEPLSGIEVAAFRILAGSAPPDEDRDELVQAGALGTASATTGADGVYEIAHLPDGEFRVVARARGFEPASIPSAAPGEPLPDVVLVPHARISGSVRDAATGAPVRSFEVKLDRREADGSFREERCKSRDVADPGGRFACEGLRAGGWRVRVLAADHVAWEKELALEPGEEAELDATLSSGCRIRGAVRRPDGTPIAGAMVSIRLAGEKQDRAPARRSDAYGEFVVAGLDAGTYEVQAAHPDHFAEAAEASAKVELSAELDASVVLVLRLAGRILGHIGGLSFEPPGSHRWIVTFSPVAPDPAGGGGKRGGTAGAEPAPQPFWLWADESGSFTRESVRPGKYRLELHHQRNTPDTGGHWVDVPPENRPLGGVEVRAGEAVSFSGEAR